MKHNLIFPALRLSTPSGDHYRIMANGNIVRHDLKGFEASGQWRLVGLKAVNSNAFIPFEWLTPGKVRALNLRYKNGNPRWTVVDFDHGTKRVWGNTKYRGVASLYYETP